MSRSYESNGPDVKIRGTAAHIAEKYMQLARDANGAGDPVLAESYLQHAEHYFRVIAAAQQAQQGQQGQQNTGEAPRQQRFNGDGGYSRFDSYTPDEEDTGPQSTGREDGDDEQPSAQQQGSQPTGEANGQANGEAHRGEEAAAADEQPAQPPRRRRRRSSASTNGEARDDSDAATPPSQPEDAKA